MDLERLFIQKSDGTYEFYQQQVVEQKKENFLLFKTFLKCGKFNIDDDYRFVPFTIEWIPNLFSKSSIGELALVYEFGHLKPTS